jgi:putative RecB family exonuclease
MKPAIQNLKDVLHISHSQLFTYLNCSLKYRYQYVEGRQPERISISLPFGKAVHKAIEHFYRCKKDGLPVDAKAMEQAFTESLIRESTESDTPLLFKKEMPDIASAVVMGKALVNTFYEEVSLDGYEIVDVELPLSATLFDQEGKPTDLQLVGFIDVLLRDAQGNYLVVDNKTSKQAKSQDAVDGDIQMTAYSYLLAANRYVFPRSEVQCRFDVLRKLKTPKLEQYHTRRGPEQRKKFSKLATAILTGIENRVFLPCKGWLCADCSFAEACAKDW